MSGEPVQEQTRAAVVQLGDEPAVFTTWGTQLPPEGVGALPETSNEPSSPQVVVGGTVVHPPVPDVVADSVTVLHEATPHTWSEWNMPMTEQDWPDAAHRHMHVSAVPVGPVFPSVG